MTNALLQPNILQRGIQRLVTSAAMAGVMASVLHRVDRPLFRITGGRATLTGLMTGLPVVTLTTTGAKSGQPRTVPLVAIPDGDQIVLIASNFGQAHHPAWYLNLCATPQATVARDGVTRTYAARTAEGAAYDDYWQRAVALYAGYAAYKERTQGRRIPILVLTPTAIP